MTTNTIRRSLEYERIPEGHGDVAREDAAALRIALKRTEERMEELLKERDSLLKELEAEIRTLRELVAKLEGKAA